MLEDEARAAIEMYTAAGDDPALSSAELDRLVVLAKRADRLGRAPSDAAWTPTWDLYYAARMGWRLKMGKAASRVTFTVDGQFIDRNAFLRNCRTMIAQYAGAYLVAVQSQTEVEARTE